MGISPVGSNPWPQKNAVLLPSESSRRHLLADMEPCIIHHDHRHPLGRRAIREGRDECEYALTGDAALHKFEMQLPIRP